MHTTANRKSIESPEWWLIASTNVHEMQRHLLSWPIINANMASNKTKQPKNTKGMTKRTQILMTYLKMNHVSQAQQVQFGLGGASPPAMTVAESSIPLDSPK
jgi:hypothetical protein